VQLICQRSQLRGQVEVPGSKSHTIRAVAIGALAHGQSQIEAPLVSADTLAAIDLYTQLGAHIDVQQGLWTIAGMAGRPTAPANVIDVRNSGSTLRIGVGSAALLEEGMAVFTGDEQVCTRPIGPLADALNDLGADVVSTRHNGRAPLVVGPKLSGGKTSIQAVTSQYLSSLLINCPLADDESIIDVPLLNEAPYVHITLEWLQRCGIELERDELRQFRIPGGQTYKPFSMRVPGDFSSATFFLGAAVLNDNEIVLRGLDLSDTQGDKAVLGYLEQMGARIAVTDAGIHVRPPASGQLTGCELDLNATPDALPMMAVLACFAQGQTTLANVPQARLKETDRIEVMAGELARMGADIQELPAGMIVQPCDLQPADVDGHHDHRVVMALTITGCAIASGTRVSSAEAIDVTFPTFVQCMTSLGAELELIEDGSR
jgi:3-phosphoshikimate 1-carboxyvinyltransferase